MVSRSTPSASRRAYEHVRRALIDGTIEDGTLLSEGDIAEAVGVSRTPVREALLQLESEGRLALYPKRGALVLPVTAREIRELFSARTLVEVDALRTVLSRREDPDLVAGLRSILSEQRSFGSSDLLAAADADRRLHRTWVAAAGNRVLLRFYDSLRDRQERVAVAMLRRGGNRPRDLVAEHAAIVAAVEDRDVEQAITRLAAHLDAASVAVVEG